MKIAEIYCHFSFLELICAKVAEYCNAQNQSISDVLKEETLSVPAVEAYKLIYRNAKKVILCIDADANKTTFEQNPYYKTLSKQGIIEASKQDFNTFDKDFYNNLYQHSYFFLNENEEKCSNIEDKYGFFCFSKNNWDKNILRITERFDPVLIWSGGQVKNYSFLQNYVRPCNAMIISDEYLSKDRSPQDNLYRILDYLLPKNLQIDFHLTIFTGDISQYADIDKKLKEIRSYPILFTIILVTKSNPVHDRNIITNYFWINSGHGFHLFQRENIVSGRNTQISFYSIFRNHCAHIIAQLKPIENSRDITNPSDSGQIKSNNNGKNKLLS